MDAIVALIDAKRAQYAGYQPVFHKAAAGAAAMQRPFLAGLIANPDFSCLTAEDGEKVVGFLQGRAVKAPPVYDPGGLVLMVDDFVVADPTLWPTVGRALLDEARRVGAARGAVLVNVVCGPLDAPKRAMLAAAGLSVASEWHVGPAR